MRLLGLFGVLAVMLLGLTPALADEWVAAKLRGTVLELADGEWRPLERGAVIPDDRAIRTMNGRVTLVRGGETIELGPDTQIQIFDEESRRPFTTVKQYFGTVAVEAEVRDVQHFAVQTPHLAAVVKGTRFTVLAGKAKSEVRVDRGAVAVESLGSGTSALVLAGQSATATESAPLHVAGNGTLPVVVDQSGEPLEDDDSGAGGDDDDNGNGNSGSGNSGNGNSGSGSGNSGNENGNSGSSNSGNGNGNSGSGNSGNGNGSSGGNSGGGNSGNGNSGNSNGNSGSGGGNGNGNSGSG